MDDPGFLRGLAKLSALATGEAELDGVRSLVAERDRLLAFAHLISGFCSDDSAGHMRYLKAQADIAIDGATESAS